MFMSQQPTHGPHNLHPLATLSEQDSQGGNLEKIGDRLGITPQRSPLFFPR